MSERETLQKEPQDNTMLYFCIAVGAIILIGGLAWIL